MEQRLVGSVPEVSEALTTCMIVGIVRQGLALCDSKNWLLMAASCLVEEAKTSAERFVSGGGGGGESNVLNVENRFRASVVQWFILLCLWYQ